MPGFIIAVLESSIAMSVLAGLYTAVTPLISKRYSAMGRYYTWLVILVGLIIPFRFHFPEAAIQVSAPVVYEAQYQEGRQAAAGSGTDVNTVVPEGIPWPSVISMIWLAGMAFFIGYHLLHTRKFRRFVRRWGRQSSLPATLLLFAQLREEMGIHKKVELRICPGIGTPMLAGLFHPAILLETEELGQEELGLILKHELVHFKRKDLYYKALVLLAGAIHWFNPVVYLIAAQISKECEMSCDAAVMQDAGLSERKRYVAAIVGTIRSQCRVKTAFSTNFNGSRKVVRKRVFSIMDGRGKKLGASLLLAAIMFTFGTGTVFAMGTQMTGMQAARMPEPLPGAAAGYIPPVTSGTETETPVIPDISPDSVEKPKKDQEETQGNTSALKGNRQGDAASAENQILPDSQPDTALHEDNDGSMDQEPDMDSEISRIQPLP